MTEKKEASGILHRPQQMEEQDAKMMKFYLNI